jgi:UDP-N-acetylmuramate-alanine ligase
LHEDNYSFQKMKKTHFIAIGGAVMHQLALALHRQGHLVTGSDDEINDPAKGKSCSGRYTAQGQWLVS